jgi:radical SAM protein with 4Fe4S-binding SPASM domain
MVLLQMALQVQLHSESYLTDNLVIELNYKVEDSFIKQKDQLTSKVQMFNGVPLPSLVEISDSGTCNRACSFCPRSDKDYPDIKEFISNKLINKLANELCEVSYEGVILFSGFVEPLLNKSIDKHVKTLRDKNPNCIIQIITNGDPITVRNLNKLFYAGLDYLLISCYDGPHQIEEINKLIEASDMPKEKIVFRNRWVGPEDNFNISLSNRAGLMSNAEYSIAELDNPLSNPCNMPAYSFLVDYLGDVIICTHDWGKKAVMGNLNRQTFFEVWTSPKFTKYRKNLLEGKRNLTPCNVCNVKGDRIGNNHAQAWK